MNKINAHNATQLVEKALSIRDEIFKSQPGTTELSQQLKYRVHPKLIEAVTIFRKIGEDKPKLVHALRRLAEVEKDMGNDEVTIALYEEAVAVSREYGDSRLLAHTIRHQGDIHRRMRNVEIAESCYNESLTLYRNQDLPNKSDLANAVRPMAILKEELEEREEAIKLWKEARGLYAEINLKEAIVECSDRLVALGAETKDVRLKFIKTLFL